MDLSIDWGKFGELVVPGIVVGVIMLLAQIGAELYREKRRLVNEEVWRFKKEAFTAAIRLVDQSLAATPWTGDAVPENHKPSGSRPESIEINTVYAQLMLSAVNPEIPKRFVQFFMKGHENTPGSRGEFIVLLRKELFSSEAPVKPEDVPWVF